MPLEDFEKFQKGRKKWVEKSNCPECNKPMDLIISAPRVIKMDGKSI